MTGKVQLSFDYDEIPGRLLVQGENLIDGELSILWEDVVDLVTEE